MSKHLPVFKTTKGKNLRIGIVSTRWNPEITASLTASCLDALGEAGVLSKNIVVLEVPGAFELPLAVQFALRTHRLDAVVAIGCLIKGETQHFEYIAESVSHGLQRVGLDTGKPVIFGVLTCLTEKQAVARSTGKNNHGYGWGQTALEMAWLTKKK